MPEILSAAADDGVRVIRVWAHGETNDATPRPDNAAPSSGNAPAQNADTPAPNLNAPAPDGGPPAPDWLRSNPFRRGPDDWNEEAFRHLDRVLAEAARRGLRVQITLANWWPDTGGVTRYLAWAGLRDAYDPRHPHNVNAERAALFYTNDGARRLYRQHVERVVSRRNTVTGLPYRDDPTILGYELMNEAQAPAGREPERRAWVAEMSAFVKSLDPHHLVTPGTWGYRNAFERRAWLEEHRLPNVDYCDVHLYPRDDADSFVNDFDALEAFLTNRAAAALSLDKPLVVGEFGIPVEGFNGRTQADWYDAFFRAARLNGFGAMFWILTHVAERPYGVTHTTARDDALRAILRDAARNFDDAREAGLPSNLREPGRHLVPHQFAFARDDEDPAARPDRRTTERDTLLYRFAPEQAALGRFEKLGSGSGYVWGAGVGFFEYVVPARADGWRSVGELVVRAHLQPTLPADANGRFNSTRVRLLVNDADCGARLVPALAKPRAHVEEWRVNSLSLRFAAARGLPLRLRFVVDIDADQPFGLTISNFPEGFDARGSAPVELEIN
ncbi:MAG TPA: cellulase family glycosylhydrolase [Pyrinomonadaceae bacterium]|nr:cellulase family glycosylhydrolase [Pyrinomonadaceae bacterium]